MSLFFYKKIKTFAEIINILERIINLVLYTWKIHKNQARGHTSIPEDEVAVLNPGR